MEPYFDIYWVMLGNIIYVRTLHYCICINELITEYRTQQSKYGYITVQFRFVHSSCTQQG